MTLPPVVVEISAADASPVLRATLVAACSRAVQDGDCTEGASPGDPEPELGAVAAVAIVSWQSDGTVRIEVGLRPGEPWHTRVLRFEEDEEPVEVFTAVGFAIGALVGRLQDEAKQQGPEPMPEPEPEPEPTSGEPAEPVPGPVGAAVKPNPSPIEPPAERPASGWVGTVGLVAGSGRVWSSWRVGAGVSVAWAHPGGALLGASGEFAATPGAAGSPRETWVGFGAGPGREIELGSELALVVFGELGAEQFSAQIQGEHASRFVALGRTGVVLVGPNRSPVSAALGVGVTVPFGATQIRIAGVDWDAAAPARVGAALGVRYDTRRRR
jgi:hypothetical protein